MPIITDPQKLSMPEQVQQNKDDIAEIFKKIDGLDSLDNVIVIDNISHILTAEELTIAREPVCFIVYNNDVFIKRKIVSDSAYFDVVFNVSGSTVISFTSKEIIANLSNGGLSITNNSASTYGTSKIDTELALKANLSGADFSGAVSAPTLKQANANYASSGGSWTTDAAHYTIEDIYTRCEEINNVLYAIVNIKLTRIDAGSLYYIGALYITLPAEIANKIYDLKGNTAAASPTTPVVITAEQAKVFTTIEASAPTAEDIPCYLNILNAAGNNRIALYLSGRGYALSGGEVFWITARIPLTLI